MAYVCRETNKEILEYSKKDNSCGFDKSLEGVDLPKTGSNIIIEYVYGENGEKKTDTKILLDFDAAEYSIVSWLKVKRWAVIEDMFSREPYSESLADAKEWITPKTTRTFCEGADMMTTQGMTNGVCLNKGVKND